MIVQCASCQTRFKIGDEKVTDRGIKVRCAKCGSIFRVRREPVPESSPAATSLADLLQASSGPASPGSQALTPDAFPPPSPQTSRFSTEHREEALALDIEEALAQPREGGEEELPPVDPVNTLLEPLGTTEARSGPLESLDGGPWGEVVSSKGASDDQSLGSLDPLAGLDLNPVSHSPAWESSAVVAGEDPANFDPSEIDFGGSLPPSAPSPATPPPPPPEARMPDPLGDTADLPRPAEASWEVTGSLPLGRVHLARAAPTGEDEPVERSLGAKIVSAFAGSSIVMLLLLTFVLYRNGGRIDLRDPLPSVFSSFGLAQPAAAPQPLPANIEDSGLYQTSQGLPLLFASGEVKNGTDRPQRLRVRLTLEDGNGERAAAPVEGWPGIIPDPGELAALRSPADLRRLQRTWDGQIPTPLAPHASAKFLVVTADVPPNLDDLLLKANAIPWVPPPPPMPATSAQAAPVPAGTATAPPPQRL